MASQIVGKYKYATGEIPDEFLNSIGKSELTNTFLQSTPVVEIQSTGDQYVITVTSQDKTVTNSFKLGEAYDERFPSQSVAFKVSGESQRDTHAQKGSGCNWGYGTRV